MLKQADRINYFCKTPEEGQNPYIGIMSFQHFRGEAMYSDIIVTPEGKRTETERVECYPISDDAEENGREQGYYPDSSVVYIRILWKEFEPERGKYNYRLIEDILNKARAHGQSLIFRLMAHSTRACDDVPEWLKALIPCPERPPMMRVKDSPKDPLFLDLFLEAVKKIGERFDTDPTFHSIDISLPGAWGEGHKLEEYPDNTLERIVDVYTDSFKNTKLIAQAGRPELIRYAERVTPVGWRGDGLGEPQHTFEKYPEKIEKISDVWKRAPVSFEAYWWLCEWQRQGWDIDRVIECTLDWHISSFNPKSMPIPYEWKEKIEYWLSKMGYHFSPSSFAYPGLASAGDEAELVLKIENTGVAPIYDRVPMYIRLKSALCEYILPTDTDIRGWMPGENSERLQITLPQDISAGEYEIGIGFMNETVPLLYLATDAPRDGSFYKLGEIKIN